MAQQAGMLDVSFGVGGKVISNNLQLIESFDNQMGISKTGKIFMAGSLDVPNNVILLSKYKQSGNKDSGFGENGNKIISLNYGSGTPFVNYIKEIKIQADGKILLAGYLAFYLSYSLSVLLLRLIKKIQFHFLISGLPNYNF